MGVSGRSATVAIQPIAQNNGPRGFIIPATLAAYNCTPLPARHRACSLTLPPSLPAFPLAYEVHKDAVSPAKALDQAINAVFRFTERFDYVVFLQHRAEECEAMRAGVAPAPADFHRFGSETVAVQARRPKPLQRRPAIWECPLPTGEWVQRRDKPTRKQEPREPPRYDLFRLVRRCQPRPEREEARQRNTRRAFFPLPLEVEEEAFVRVPHQFAHCRGALLGSRFPVVRFVR